MTLGDKIKEAGIKLPRAVKKRGNGLTNFEVDKIFDAINSAYQDIRKTENNSIAEEATIETIKILNAENNYSPEVDEINETAVKALKNIGCEDVARGFENYAEQRKKVRISGGIGGQGSTDEFLMVSSTSNDSSKIWKKDAVIHNLVDEAEVDYKTAKHVAKRIENQLIDSEIHNVSTDLIRELAITELLKLGKKDAVDNYMDFSVPRRDLEGIIGFKNTENSNIQTNNPEAVHYTFSGIIGKKYSLSRIFSKDIANAHSNGELHLHDLDMPTRVYCSAHSLEYLKKWGLNEIKTLQTSSKPTKHASTLTGHLNTFCSTMQMYYAGALGIGYYNIMFAPLIEKDLEDKGLERIADREMQLNELRKEDGLESIIDKKQKELENYKKNPRSILTEEETNAFVKQIAQEGIYSGSQNASSRGGQNIFLDFNIHTGVPEYLKDTPAILPGGKYGILRDGEKVFLDEEKVEGQKTPSGYDLMQLMDDTGKVVMKEKMNEEGSELVQEWFLGKGEEALTYGKFDSTSKLFAKQLLEVYGEGDKNGQPFAFPKPDLHISRETFEDAGQIDVLEKACEVASDNGSPYFIFDRDEVSLAACCRLRTAIEDNYVIKHPESMRFCGFQNVTINLPQAAYRASKKGNKSLEGFLEEVDNTMNLAVKAHLQKKEFAEKMQQPGFPQWQTGDKSLDGQKYVDLEKSTYILGMIGLNEAVQTLTGKELHELDSKEFGDYALKTVAHMNIKAKEHGKKYGLKFSLEETPAESASRRLSKTDLTRFPEEAGAVVKGDIEGDQTYYSNSIHPRADAPISLTERIRLQGKFHSAIESGAITHAFVGEEKPSSESIYNLVKKTFDKTQTAQLTISPEFTTCKSCHNTGRGLVDKCGSCGNEEDLNHMTRVVGYYSFVDNWNPSKQEEREARHKGDYSILKNGNKKEIPSLQNPYDGITAVTIGKEGCALCDDLKQVTGYKKIVEEAGEKFNIVSYEANNEDGLTNAMLGDINLSQLPALVVLDKNSKEIYRGQTIGKNGSTIPINPQEVEGAIDNYLKAQYN